MINEARSYREAAAVATRLDRTYVIAEMACSHEGDPGLARQIIDGAGAAGANAIQFQIWQLEDMMVGHHPAFGDVKKLELTRLDWRELAHYVRARWPDMAIIACVYEQASVDFAESLVVDAYKLHSADLSNPTLVDYVAATKRRIDLSIGASTISEIDAALGWIRGASDSDVWLMYGYQAFPTPTDAIDLALMIKLRELFELPVGYQDHTAAELGGAFWLPAAAIGMGADIVEKHITHDRALAGADHEAALNPSEFGDFVEMVREIEIARGSGVPRPFNAEEERYRVYSKKSLVARHLLPAGATLGEGDVVALRGPELGLPPARLSELLGRRLKSDIQSQHLIGLDDVE